MVNGAAELCCCCRSSSKAGSESSLHMCTSLNAKESPVNMVCAYNCYSVSKLWAGNAGVLCLKFELIMSDSVNTNGKASVLRILLFSVYFL